MKPIFRTLFALWHLINDNGRNEKVIKLKLHSWGIMLLVCSIKQKQKKKHTYSQNTVCE